MSTQAVVSVRREGKILCKAVAGCNGFTAVLLARLIRKKKLIDPRAIWGTALEIGYGCQQCLVVQTGPEVFVPSNAIDDAADLARWARTFEDPQFNPRWEIGTAAQVQIVDI